jgi:hypothetical protein
MARLNGPVRPSWFFRGMVSRIWCRVRYWRLFRLRYPLSPTTRCGRHLGRPGPIRLTAPLAMSWSNMLASCRWPGGRRNVMSLPPLSARTCTVVLNPPRRRPSASPAGSLFWPPPRADAPAPWCHRRSALPSRSCPPHRPGFVLPPRYAPNSRLCATARNGWPPWTRGHSAQANPARERRCAESTRGH